MDQETTKIEQAEQSRADGWQYKVAYVDFRQRISVEGQETYAQRGDHSTEFVRRFLDGLGRDGWELVGIHPQMPPETAYFVFKKPGAAPAEQPKAVDETKGEAGETSAEGQPPSAPHLSA